MGIAISKEADLNSNEFITRFIGKKPIAPDDPFWTTFLSYNLTPPYHCNDQLVLESRIDPFLQQFLTTNLSSGNLSALIQVFLSKATELLTSNNADNHIFSWQTNNALFIIRCILKYFTELISEEQLIEQVEHGSDNNTAHLETLFDILFGIIVDVPITDVSYGMHYEAVTTLLVLLSVLAHSNVTAEQSVIYRLLMKGKHSIHAPLFMKVLLQHFIAQKKAPPYFGQNGGSSMVLGLASDLWSLLTFSRKPVEVESVEGGDNAETPLATNSLLLILVLSNHCSIQPNPYRQCLFACLDSQDNSTIQPTQATSIFKIDYGQLYSVLCRKVCGDSATLLLYLLLHRNPWFKKHLISRLDLDQLVIPILKTLYHAPNSNSHHIYMSLIILLILSEDESFNRTIHETKLKAVPWYTERILSEVSLGGLLILVVIRTIQYNMLKMKDKYLHTNCLAALANMSAQFRNLHPYVSQRIVSLFETLAKRYQRFRLDVELENRAEEVAVPLAPDASDSEQYLGVLEEVLRMILEIFNSALMNQLPNNPNLVYTLLYKKDIFTPFKTNSAFLDIIHNIEIILDFFSDMLSSHSQYEVDAPLVLNVIKDGARSWPKDRLTKFPDLKFKYVEEEQPEDFFLPYVWSLVSQQINFHWKTERTSNLNDVR